MKVTKVFTLSFLVTATSASGLCALLFIAVFPTEPAD